MTDVVRRFKREIPDRVVERRPKAKGGGRPVANRALQQLEAALGFAYRMDWISRNTASARFVPRYEENRAEDFLDIHGYGAVGQVLRDLEARLARDETSPLSLRTIFALRVAIYTGVRHRSELLWTRLEWCHLDDRVPRIGIPRAKGDRLTKKGGGRWIFLGPEAVRLLRAMPRPAGSEHLTVPGDKPGQPLFRLVRLGELSFGPQACRRSRSKFFGTASPPTR
jgi:integrase